MMRAELRFGPIARFHFLGDAVLARYVFGIQQSELLTLHYVAPERLGGIHDEVLANGVVRFPVSAPTSVSYWWSASSVFLSLRPA